MTGSKLPSDTVADVHGVLGITSRDRKQVANYIMGEKRANACNMVGESELLKLCKK